MINPADYVPAYDDSVVESFNLRPEVGFWPINERYCLLPASAAVLAGFWTPRPAIVMLPPITQVPGSPFAFNHPVPWLKFADGTLRNAAVLAGYWGMPGVPASQALDYAKLDVSTPVEGS